MITFFLYQRRKTIILITLLVISLFLLMLSSENSFKNLKKFLWGGVVPFQKGADSFYSFTDNFWKSLNKFSEIKQELKDTIAKLQVLEDASIEIDELKRENERLRNIVTSQAEIKTETIAAEIIGRDPQNTYRAIIVNHGKKKGVKINMPVITYQNAIKGIVGKVVETTDSASKIMLLTDQGNFISAMFKDTRHIGICKGEGSKSDYLSMDYVTKEALINFGDFVITSGQGGIYPKGLVIGTVEVVSKKVIGPYLSEIKIKPIINFSKLETVYIIKKPASEDVFKLLKE